jgi:hypothetical protein
MKLSEIFEIISKHFEVSKRFYIWQGFVHDNYFRKFIKSYRIGLQIYKPDITM